MNKIALALITVLLLSACNGSSDDKAEEKNVSVTEENTEVIKETQSEVEKTTLSPVEKIIDSVYHKYGAEKIEHSNITFDFRKFEFAYLQGKNGVKRSRKFKNDAGENVVDIWQGDSLIRLIEGERVAISDKKEKAYKNSINSVFYFSFSYQRL